jgi:tetratricopeptide (TPR) repeat protein
MELRDELQRTLGTAYRLERELGGGGMSKVFVAEEVALSRKVVVKVLPPTLTGGVNIERFKREIQVAARLQHAHIVPVLTAGETNGLPYYTMPFVDGESLRGRLVRGGALPLTETISILRDVARALAYAHDHNVVHRDIKPDNVMLSGGSAVVSDFGIAKAITASRTHGDSSTLTQVGTSLGTPAYMAPEHAAADPASDHRVDLYAFGCVAYEMLAGLPPFVEKSPQQLLAAQMSKTPEPIAARRPDTPAALAELVMRCLEKDAELRPPSASEIARTLDTVTSGGTLDAMPSILLASPTMLRRALVAYAGAFITVALVAKAAIVVIGLPDWVYPGSLIVMALGLPVILFTGYVQRVARVALTSTPTYTPGGTPSMQGHGTMASMAMKASPHMSWRRTTIAGAVAVGAFALLVAVFMGMRALGVGPAASLLSSGKLTASDQILVADFKTGGADSALSGVLAEAMRSSLSKSRRVRITQASAVAAGLQRMGRPMDSRLELPLAQELAQRDGLKAIVAGELTAVSGGYLVTVKLLAAASGDVLASLQESADGATALIPTMDRLGRRLRDKIGESLRDVHATAPLARVGTGSLEALRKFTEGARANDAEGDWQKAVKLLNEAIALDSSFAMAYRKLSLAYGNMGDFQQARQVIDRAFALRDRVPEAERLAMLAVYYASGSHPDRAKVISSYEELFARYPEWLAIISSDLLADYLEGRREYARAESLRVQMFELAPDERGNYLDIVRVQVALGKTDAAMASIARARARTPSPGDVDGQQSGVWYAAGNIDSAKAVRLRQAAGKGGSAANAKDRLAVFALRAGKLGEWSKQLTELYPRQPALENPFAAFVAARVLRRPDEARRRMAAFIARTATPSPALGRILMEAVWFGSVGDTARARARLAQFDAAADSIGARIRAPTRHLVLAWLAFHAGRSIEAVAEFRAADMQPDGPATSCAVCADPNIGLAFDQANMPDSALAVFEHFVNTPSWGRLDIDALNLPWILRRVGELHEARGEVAKAADYYRKFVDIWKDADPELQPQVSQVRDRLRRMADIEPRSRP